MNQKLNRMKHDLGFIAALDQSGGSTPKALAQYGVAKESYNTDEEMFNLVHEMRTRIIKSPAFSSDKILGTILFEMTMDRQIDGLYTADYLWNVKGILPFLKIDKGLEDLENGVQLMKPIHNLDALLQRALLRNIFGTKMRSVIKEANYDGIKEIVKQQFDYALEIAKTGLVPILEPEIDIHMENKKEAENILKKEIFKHLELLSYEVKLMFKLTIPTIDNFYEDLMHYPNVVRVVALSGGYTRDEANTLLAKNHGLIASFSRALLEGLSATQDDLTFNDTLSNSIQSIYDASIK